MIDGGGVHVIQAFFSTEHSEEIQIMGRTARQGDHGSFSMVILASSLGKLGVTSEDIESMRLQSKLYTSLNSKRSLFYSAKCNQRKDAVKKAETKHYETVHFKQCALAGERRDAIAYLEQWNGISAVTLPSMNQAGTKKSFLEQKRKRIAKRQENEKKKRLEAQLRKVQPPHIEEDASREGEGEEFFECNFDPDVPPAVKDQTHYSVLGVSSDASKDEIERAFRKAAPSCHPDSKKRVSFCHFP